jgi:competence protein ComEC
MLRHALVACGGWVAGVALQLQQAALADPVIYAAVALVALPALWLAPRLRTGAQVLCLALALGALGWASTGLRAAYFARSALLPALEGRDVQVVGVVSDLPRRTPAGVRFRFALDSATLDGQAIELPPLLEVAWYSGPAPTAQGSWELQTQPADLRAGQRWAFTLRAKAPHGSRNPHGFDYELWLWDQGVQATGYVRSMARDPPPRLLDDSAAYPVARLRQHVRQRIDARLGADATPDGTADLGRGPDVAGLLAALVVGDQAAIERGDWEAFRATGLAHLVSISGLHITMFAWAAVALVGWLWRRSVRLCMWFPAPRAALLGGIALACAYAAFSGWGIPAQRTCAMLVLFGAVRWLGLRWPWPMVWSVAAALVVALNPWGLLQAGFWLSFWAVAVLFASDGARGPLRSLDGPYWWRMLGRLRALAHEQWVLTLALAPLTLFIFGQVSLVGLVANLFAVPWVTVVLTPLAIAGVVLPPLWDAAALAAELFLACARGLAAWPSAALVMPLAPWWLLLTGLVGAVALVLPWRPALRCAGLPLVACMLLWQPPRAPPGEFTLLAVDIGQGNAVLVQTAHHALLYDSGPRYGLDSDAGNRVLVPLLQAQGVRLDRLVLSHRDSDHTGGAAAVLHALRPQQVLTSMDASEPLARLAPLTRCEAGHSWEWDGVQFTFLYPRVADYPAVGARPVKPNALSCVLRISNGRSSVLLAGDIESAQEEALLLQPEALRADVLLVPHHGSKTSSSEAFIAAVSPRWALVQSGYRNRYGHPAAPVVERYRARGIALVDSPHCGAMHWRSTQPGALACERELHARYWQHRPP